ncbi:MAG: hypothetical protein ACLFVC_05635 [Opitutales bacterium]
MFGRIFESGAAKPAMKLKLLIFSMTCFIGSQSISQNDHSVRLNGTQGQSWLVPLEKLSNQDRAFIDLIEGNPGYDIRSSTSSMLDHRKIGEDW